MQSIVANHLLVLSDPSASSHSVADNRESREARLLLEAFEMFTQASSSLENAHQQLQARAERLSQELEAKNKELKKSLREKEEVRNYLKAILECLPCGVVVLDKNQNVTLCNPLASDVLGLPEHSSPKTRLKTRVIPNLSMREYFEAAHQGTQPTADVEVPVFTGEHARVLATSGTPLCRQTGERIGTVHIIRDVTQIKKLEERNKRTERLSAMGEMAVELAHEIRNPLGSIELFASLLEKELPTGSDMGRWAENIRVGSRSLNNIVSNMLQFANPLAPDFTMVDVHDVIDEILSFADPIMRQREVDVQRHLGATRPWISGDRELLKQMLLNLILNAMQAMPAKGLLEIATADVHELPGGAVCEGFQLKIRDTGFGIPQENLARIFDPFFTTNKNGTGLGLSVVHQIVEKHSGFIQVASRVNEGTTFTVILPGGRELGAA